MTKKTVNEFYGVGSETLSLGTSEAMHRCPNCEENHKVDFSFSYTYNHIFNTLGFVSNRKYLATCSQCHNKVEIDSIQIKMFAGEPKIPFLRRFGWVFIVAIVGCILAFSAPDYFDKDSRNTKKTLIPEKHLLKKLEKVLEGLLRAFKEADKNIPEDKESYSSKKELQAHTKARRRVYVVLGRRLKGYFETVRGENFTALGGNLESSVKQILIPGMLEIVSACDMLSESLKYALDDKKLTAVYNCIKIIQDFEMMADPKEEDQIKVNNATSKLKFLTNNKKVEEAEALFQKGIDKITVFESKANYKVYEIGN